MYKMDKKCFQINTYCTDLKVKNIVSSVANDT